MVLGKTWFKQHQKGLLFLANAPVIKYWFRWVLGLNGLRFRKVKRNWMLVRSNDCSLKERIIEIQPNNYKVDAGFQFFKRSALLKTTSQNPEVNRCERRLRCCFQQS